MSESATENLPATQEQAPAKKPNFELTASGAALRDSNDLYRMASMLVKTNMVPKGYAGKIEQAYAAILTGAELGLSPAASLRTIAVVNGTPTIYGGGGYSLAMRHELYDRHEITWQLPGEEETGIEPEFEFKRPAKGAKEEDADPTAVSLSVYPDGFRCICRAWRKGCSEPFIAKFSVADAKRAFLWGRRNRDGEPLTWCLYPTRMMMHKAVGNALEAAIPEAYLGMFKVAEGEDETAASEDQPQKIPDNGTTRLRAPKAKPVAQAAPPPEPPAAEEVVDVTPEKTEQEESPAKEDAPPTDKQIDKEFRLNYPDHPRARLAQKSKTEKKHYLCECGASWDIKIVAGIITFPKVKSGDGSCAKKKEPEESTQEPAPEREPGDDTDPITSLPNEELNRMFEETLKAAHKGNIPERRKNIAPIMAMVRRKLVLAEGPIQVQQAIQWTTRANFILALDGEKLEKLKADINTRSKDFQK